MHMNLIFVLLFCAANCLEEIVKLTLIYLLQKSKTAKREK